MKLIKLNQGTCTPQEFSRFERIARLAAAANNWTDQMLIYHVLGNLVGQASDNARSLSDNINSYTNLADFFQTLKERFVTSAHASMARNAFNFAVQKNDENILNFEERFS